MSSPKVVIKEHKTKNDFFVGEIVLNKPKALNALDLEMAAAMLDILNRWSARDDIVCVVISAAGDKAFCAGGDIVSMYNAMKSTENGISPFLTDFFTTEYTLDYTIHYYPKPIVVWGSGIVMGGGMGLLCGASHRVVTQSSRLAMPEITIGLYPDVGGSYFLPRLPGKSGVFLGLTGGQINCADACFVGLADFLINESAYEQMLGLLTEHQWSKAAESEQVSTLLAELPPPSDIPDSKVEQHRELIDRLCAGATTESIVSAILQADLSFDKWLARAQKTLASGSPITAHLVVEQCKKGASMSLAACYKMEAIMSLRCGEYGEFQEGVRALLIDKDNAPNWHYKHVNDVPKSVIESFFESPWKQGEHPLQHLK